MSSFKKDYNLGKKGEEFVKNLLEKCGYKCEEVDSLNKSAYDIVATPQKGKKFTIECKYDSYSQISSNLALEYFNPKTGKPSGIYVTTAQIYCYLLPDGINITAWIISTIRLREFIKTETPLKNLERVGDGNASILLYKLDHILPKFTRIDNIPCDEVTQAIKRLLKEKGNKVI